jgi:hypothetical protein
MRLFCIFSSSRIEGTSGWSNHHCDWAQTLLSNIAQFEECSQSSTVSNIFVTFTVNQIELGFQCGCQFKISSAGSTLQDDLQLDSGGVGGQVQVVESY